MGVRTVDDKPSDTLVVDSGEGFWTGSSTLPHLHQLPPTLAADEDDPGNAGVVGVVRLPVDDVALRVPNGSRDPHVLAVDRRLDPLALALGQRVRVLDRVGRVLDVPDRRPAE